MSQLIADPRNPLAQRHATSLRVHLGDWDREPTIVIGGDGFLLRTVAEHGLDRTYLGLNAGHLGFLLNDVEDWQAVARALKEDRFRVGSFPMLATTITRQDGEVVEDRAINDVYLERTTSQTARLELSIDGHTVVDLLVADGIVFSTALGSTAYTFSAGGPACHPELRLLAVTPICPHHPRLHPFALPQDSRASVRIIHGERRPVRAVADGRAVDDVARVDVALDDQEVRLAYFPEHDLTSRMIRKILHP